MCEAILIGFSPKQIEFMVGEGGEGKRGEGKGGHFGVNQCCLSDWAVSILYIFLNTMQII